MQKKPNPIFPSFRSFFLFAVFFWGFPVCKGDVASDTSIPLTSANLPASSLVFPSEKDKWDFLQGKYEPQKYLVVYQNPEDPQRNHYLLPEVREALKEMLQAFREEIGISHPRYKQTIFLVSSFRSFSQQKAIWEEKWKGKRKMRESIQGKTPEEIADLILEYSSAPGTSRHHWGTDFDINSLENSYFEKGGKGEILYEWLEKSAKKFGFCRPYNELERRNGKGYKEEKWHWSYRPLSSYFRKMWLEGYESGKIRVEGFIGSEILHERARVYVSSVNNNCY